MFGYVTTNKPELKVRELYRYQNYYCGLCQTLKRRYGHFSRFYLTYDMTFLAMLLTGLYEPDTARNLYRCPTRPLRKMDILSNEYLDYAADMTILLCYYKCLDDWHDDRKAAAWLGSRALKEKVGRLAGRYPRQYKAVRRYIRLLTAKEEEGCSNVDLLSGLTGRMLAEIFAMKEDVWAENLRGVGFYLGKFIYLMDAYDDLEKDKEKHRFNPLIRQSGRPDLNAYVRDALNTIMACCAAEFEKLPILLDVEILRNILYAGVWTRYEKVARREKAEEKKE